MRTLVASQERQLSDSERLNDSIEKNSAPVLPITKIAYFVRSSVCNGLPAFDLLPPAGPLACWPAGLSSERDEAFEYFEDAIQHRRRHQRHDPQCDGDRERDRWGDGKRRRRFQLRP